MGQLPGELQRVGRVLNFIVGYRYPWLPVDSTDCEAPIGIDVEYIILRVECQFSEKGLPSHDEDKIPDAVGFAWQVLREFMLVEQLISCRESGVYMHQSAKEATRAKTGKTTGDIYRSRFLLHKFPTGERVQGVVLDSHVVPDTCSKEIEDFHVPCAEGDGGEALVINLAREGGLQHIRVFNKRGDGVEDGIQGGFIEECPRSNITDGPHKDEKIECSLLEQSWSPYGTPFSKHHPGVQWEEDEGPRE